MEDNNKNIEELRKNNEKTTKESPGDIPDKHKKCGCFIF